MISKRFEEAAARWAEHAVIRVADDEISYESLNRDANHVARTLIELGDAESALPVGVLCSDYARTTAALFGVWKAGRIVLLLDPHQPAARLRTIAEHAGCREFICDADVVEAARALTPRVLIECDRLPQTECANPQRRVDNNRPLAIVYTSGSTGIPKGVVHDHDSLMSASGHWIEHFNFAPGDQALFVGNPSSVAGLNDLIKYSISGVTTTPFRMQRGTLSQLLSTMARERTTLLHTVPSAFRAIAGALESDDAVRELRLLHLGGEPLFRSDVALFRRHFPRSCKLVNNLGLTEAPTSMQFVVEPEIPIESTVVPVGRAVAGKSARIVDEHDRDVECGQVGVLRLEGPTLSRGYHREPELTASCFSGDLDGQGDGWRSFLTGDLARFDSDGLLTIIGRADDQLKIRGHRLELAEVELALRESVDDATRELAVVARGESDEEKRVAVYLVPHVGRTIDTGTLKAQLAARLPAHALPSHYVLLEAIPRTRTGKVDRTALPSPVSPPTRNDRKRRGRIATELALLWGQFLELPEVGDDDDFFELGGDSLKALELGHGIEQLFGQSLTLPEMMQAATLRQMAELIESGAERQPQPCLVPFKTDGDKLPLHLIHGMGGGVVIFRELARKLDPQRPVFAYQARGLDGISPPLRSVDAMATSYLEELRRAQPRGPYLLAGFSMGGTIAFEMARRLQEAGEQIEALIPIDSAAPLPLGWRDIWRRNWIMSRIMVRHLVKRPPKFAQRRQYNFAIDKLPMIHYRALRRYRPQPYAGSMDLVSSLGFSDELEDGDRDLPIALQLEQHQSLKKERWRELLGGELRIHPVRGKHSNLLQRPALEGLMDSLRSILESH